MTNGTTREAWGSRLGLILAAAGNAVGIGNLLRFPGQAAQHGGGAFMIPYVVCLLVFGLPMMWVAWALGRHGGRYGHGSLPGMFQSVWRAPIAKYVGVLGLALPMVFALYYTYIEAWCLGYAYFAWQGSYESAPGRFVSTTAFFNQFLGNSASETYFSGGVKTALAFMGVTLALNLFVLSRGVARGIELLAKVAMPLLFLFCLALAVRVFTYPGGQGSAIEGLNFLWTPDLSQLGNPKVWLAAAGQIFFTLSIGIGGLECYASYVRESEDIALTGLTTAATNEFVEVIFGSLIAIPAIALFYGVARLTPEAISEMGAFGLGMIAMPEILRTFPNAPLFGSIWFLLLFFAAFTSSVAVAQPVMAFLQDELRRTRAQATLLLGLCWGLATLPVVYFYKYGVLDELDLWAGTIGLVVVALIEALIFGWVWGVGRGRAELARGARIRVPALFGPLIRYVTPLALAAILISWSADTFAGDKLAPRPKFDLALAQPELAEAELVSLARFPADPADDDAASAAARANAAELERAVAEEALGDRADGQVWLDVQFFADGRAQVEDLRANGSLADFADAQRWTQYLNAKGYAYRVSVAPGVPFEPAEVRRVVVARVLHTAPYVWLARGMLAGFIALGLALVAVAFRGRDMSGAHA